MRKLAVVLALVLLPFASARAQSCPGVAPWVFADVSASHAFCTYVTWMAQNNVTLGCRFIDPNTREYCPDDYVTRLQMAAFMNRLGNALFPLTCAPGQVMKWNGAAWTCSDDNIGGSGGGGTVTSVLAGTGLAASPNPIVGAGAINLAASYQLPQSCSNGQVPKSSGPGGNWTCGTDNAGTGTVTSVTAGTGLTGGTITAAGTIAIATGGVTAAMLAQNGCASGQVLKWNGSAWACAADTAGPANAYVQGGNAFGAAAVLGTTDDQPLVLRANSITGLRVWGNPLAVNGTATVVGGSSANSFQPGAHGVTIAGGGTDFGDADPDIPGNEGPNVVTGSYGAIGGGAGNTAGLPGGAGGPAVRPFATVSGGLRNVASGTGSAVGGGQLNWAAGFESAIGGGGGNVAAGRNSFVAGGNGNCAGGNYSFAAGFAASVRPGNGAPSLCFPSVGDSGDADGDQGTFVWADSQSQLFVSTGPDQFLVRARGGVGVNRAPLMDLIEFSIFAQAGGPNSFANLYLGPNDPDFGGILMSGGGSTAATNNAIFALDQYRNLNGDEGQVRRLLIDAAGRVALNRDVALIAPFSVGTDGTNGNAAFLSAGGAWTNGSSREFKESFASVDGREVLARVVALPIHTWRYRGSEEGQHMGPTAEDFAQSFGLGAGNRYIATVDADGVALAAIQGLNAKLEARLAEKDAAIAARDAEIAQLKAGLAELRRAVELVNARMGGDDRVAAR